MSVFRRVSVHVTNFFQRAGGQPAATPSPQPDVIGSIDDGGKSLDEVIAEISVFKAFHEESIRGQQMPLQERLMKLLDSLHEVELEMRLLDLLVATSLIEDEQERQERFSQGKREIKTEFLTGYKDLLNQREAVVENGQMVKLTPAKRDELSRQQGETIDRVLAEVENRSRQMARSKQYQEQVDKRRGELALRSETLFEEKNELTMQIEGDLNEELRERIKHVEEQKQRVLSSNLLLICEIGDIERARTLIEGLESTAGLSSAGQERKAQIDKILTQRDRDGNTPALIAALKGCEAIVHLLEQKNPSVLLDVNNDKVTILHQASRHGNHDLVKWLIDRIQHERINSPCTFGRTPLHYATFAGHSKAAQLLLASGADINAVSAAPQLFTPLHSAVTQGRVDVVALLLEHPSIDLLKKDGQDFSAFEIAVANQHSDLVQLLASKIPKDKLPDLVVSSKNRKLARAKEVVTLLDTIALSPQETAHPALLSPQEPVVTSASQEDA